MNFGQSPIQNIMKTRVVKTFEDFNVHKKALEALKENTWKHAA